MQKYKTYVDTTTQKRMHTDLEDLIKRSPKAAEVKLDIAIKQDLMGKSRKLIAEVLSVAETFIKSVAQLI